jgi:hypothetical protein
VIKVTDGDDTASATPADSGDGWIVKVTDAFSKQRRFYPYTGGAYMLNDDGSLGRQLRGTRDEKAPRAAAAMRSFLKKYVIGTV